MAYDPLIYRGCAAHYLVGRPPYSAELATVLRRELALDGTGALLDVGCGPGVLAVQLAPLFERVIAIEPDPDMVSEARRHAQEHGRTVEYHVARAEDIPALDLPPMRVVTFGQSFHWVDQEPVTEALYDLLEPGGAIVLVTHDIDARPRPEGPGDPPIPHDEIQAVVRRFLGPERRAGSGHFRPSAERYEAALTRTRFGAPSIVHAPGREDLTRDIDGVISGYLSMSYAAPHRFGDRLESFVGEARELLASRTPTGRFWDWPGDTVLLIARRAN